MVRNLSDGGEKSADGVISEEAGKLVNVQAQVDSRTKLFALHDFDLDISVAGLENIEGPGGVHNGFMLAYMARKGQLEPTCSGIQVILSFWGQQYKLNAVCSQPLHTMDRDAVYLE